jgi:hypothetical protein
MYGSVYIYEANNLSNIMEIYNYRNQCLHETRIVSFFLNTLSSSFYSPVSSNWLSYVFRSIEPYYSSCDNTTYLDAVFSFDELRTLYASANSSGNCLTSILLPPLYDFTDNCNVLPVLHIYSINYTGPESVKVFISLTNNVDYNNGSYAVLFEFTQETCKDWFDVNIYGNLINFIIPSDGSLNISYESWKNVSHDLEKEYIIDDRRSGFVQTDSYPLGSCYQNRNWTIKCNKGFANITIQIVYVDIATNGYLTMVGDGNNIPIIYTSTSNYSQVVNFNATEVRIEYYIGNDDYAHRGN